MHTERSQASRQSSEERGRSLERLLKEKGLQRKANLGDLKRIKSKRKHKKDKKGVLARMLPISCMPPETAGEQVMATVRFGHNAIFHERNHSRRLGSPRRRYGDEVSNRRKVVSTSQQAEISRMEEGMSMVKHGMCAKMSSIWKARMRRTRQRSM